MLRLLRDAAGLELGTTDRARWMAVEDAVRDGPVGDPDWITALSQTARDAAAAGDLDAALDLLVAAASRCYLAGLPDERWTVLAVADALGLDIDVDDQRVLYVHAFAAPIERGGAVRRTVDRNAPSDDAGALYLRGMAACLCGAIDRAGPLLAISTQRMREEGRLRALARALSTRGWAALMRGDLATAAAVIEESLRLCEETMQPEWKGSTRAAQASVAALRGDRSLVEWIAGEIEPGAVTLRVASQLSLLQYARGLLELGYGRHAEAWTELRRIGDPAGAAYHELSLLYAIADVGEAAARTGHRNEGLALVDALDGRVTGDDAAWPQAVLLYAKAQLADDDDAAEALFVDALSRDLGVGPLLRARFNLTYGEWLRRRRRGPPGAARPRRELRAAGEVEEHPVGHRLDEITPQELQIVQLAAGGLSNREIADRLYLSHRSVESHLYRVFPKLGVTSRGQLRDALGPELGTVD
jgi:DNA-binding CsgD family transcriptional regulator